MSEIIRVLHVLHGMDCGGAENMIMNLYRNIDREKIQFDFLVHTNKKCFFDEEIKSLGGRLFHVPYYNVKNYSEYKESLNEFFKLHNEIKIVHGHLGSCAFIYLNIAKSYGCFTIAHSHNTLPTNKSMKNLLYRLFTLKTRTIADYFMACGYQAGLDRFGAKIVNSDRFSVLNNAIDTKKYIYDSQKRRIMREELGVSDDIVIGHIGRFNYQKNHEYLIKLFYEYQKKKTNVKLLLIGDGDLRQKIEKQIYSLGISDKIIFTGIRNDIPDLLQAMDCFVFPSHFEGLPVTLIEAQAASLPCVISDMITDEVVITDLIIQRSLDSNYNKWIEAIDICLTMNRSDKYQDVVKCGYDIDNTVRWLERFYQKLLYKRGIN